MSDIAPDRFLDNVFAYQKTAAVKAAIELDIFSAIGAGADSVPALAAKVNAAPRGVRILCDYLTVQELLIKDGSRYRLTPSSSVFLDKRSPACMTSVVDFLAASELMQLYLESPAQFVRNGGSVGLANLAPDHPLWVKFARAMVPFMAPIAQGIAAEVAHWPSPPRKVLDIAAGHGVFGIAIGNAIPGARIVAIDWAPVLEVAIENARREGIEQPYTTIPGSAFDVDWGDGYDLVLIPNFLHHFDREGCVSILARARRALAPRGAVARGRDGAQRRSGQPAISGDVRVRDAGQHAQGRRLDRERAPGDGPCSRIRRQPGSAAAAFAANDDHSSLDPSCEIPSPCRPTANKVVSDRPNSTHRHESGHAAIRRTGQVAGRHRVGDR